MTKLLHYVSLLCLLSLVGWSTARAQEAGPIVVNGVLTSWSGASGEITIPDEVTEIAPNVFLKNNRVTALHLNQGGQSGQKCLSRDGIYCRLLGSSGGGAGGLSSL